MFAKVFEQIYDSSIAENYLTRLVFEDMLTLADINGVVDKTHEALSRRTNVPIDVIKKGIAELERPDNRSRRPEHDGRRIVRLDEHRDWGWLIVNYEYYRKIASEEQRREKTRERVQKFRENIAARPPLQSPKNKNAEAEADVDVEGKSLPSVTVALHSVTDFDVFWKLYPNKTGKGAARKAFEKMKCKDKMDVIKKSIESQAKSDKWTKDGGQYIPNPATWLNQERWLDEVLQPATHKPYTDPKNAARDHAVSEIMARLKTERLATPEESYPQIAERLMFDDKYGENAVTFALQKLSNT